MAVKLNKPAVEHARKLIGGHQPADEAAHERVAAAGEAAVVEHRKRENESRLTGRVAQARMGGWGPLRGFVASWLRGFVAS